MNEIEKVDRNLTAQMEIDQTVAMAVVGQNQSKRISDKTIEAESTKDVDQRAKITAKINKI